jgi:GNAT superfamily N-acetyltransferase
VPIPHDCFPEYLTEENVPGCFRCGDSELDGFIVENALDHQKTLMAQTILIKTTGGDVAGYFSLCADALIAEVSQPRSLRKIIRRQCGKSYPSWPALKIGRLGVCLDRQNQGIGSAIIDYVLGMVEEVQAYVGVRFISIDAYTGSEAFYSRLGFERHTLIPEDEGEPTVSMRLDLYKYQNQQSEPQPQ